MGFKGDCYTPKKDPDFQKVIRQDKKKTNEQNQNNNNNNSNNNNSHNTKTGDRSPEKQLVYFDKKKTFN